MMKKRNIIMSVILTLSMSAALLSGCGSSSDTVGETGSAATEAEKSEDEAGVKILNAMYPYATDSIDPKTDFAQLLRAGVGETLYKITDDLTVEPWLAESASGNEDSSEWVITLKDGIKFSNGDVCDAEAVKVWIERMMSECTAVESSLNIAAIETDGLNITFKLNAPNAIFLNELAQPQAVILDYDAGNFDTQPIATGPYKIDTYTPNVGMELSRNENYWDGEVPFDKVNFTINTDVSARQMALESGDADMIANPSYDSVSALEEEEGISAAVADFGARANYIDYNCAETSKYTSNENFRKGVDALIDRDTIVESVYNGAAQKAVGCIPTDTDYTPEYEEHAYDTAKALEYFEAAGLTVDNGQVTDNGETITLKFNCYDSQAEYPTVAQLIQASLQSVGINAEISMCATDINSWLGDEANDTAWDISMASMFAMPKGDPSNIIKCCFARDSIYNYLGIEDEELYTLVEAVQNEGNIEKRIQDMKDVALLVEDHCYISLFVNPKNVIAYRDNISGVDASPNEYYFITKDLDVVE